MTTTIEKSSVRKATASMTNAIMQRAAEIRMTLLDKKRIFLAGSISNLKTVRLKTEAKPQSKKTAVKRAWPR